MVMVLLLWQVGLIANVKLHFPRFLSLHDKHGWLCCNNENLQLCWILHKDY